MGHYKNLGIASPLLHATGHKTFHCRPSYGWRHDVLHSPLWSRDSGWKRADHAAIMASPSPLGAQSALGIKWSLEPNSLQKNPVLRNPNKSPPRDSCSVPAASKEHNFEILIWQINSAEGRKVTPSYFISNPWIAGPVWWSDWALGALSAGRWNSGCMLLLAAVPAVTWGMTNWYKPVHAKIISALLWGPNSARGSGLCHPEALRVRSEI